MQNTHLLSRNFVNSPKNNITSVLPGSYPRSTLAMLQQILVIHYHAKNNPQQKKVPTNPTTCRNKQKLGSNNLGPTSARRRTTWNRSDVMLIIKKRRDLQKGWLFLVGGFKKVYITKSIFLVELFHMFFRQLNPMWRAQTIAQRGALLIQKK